MDNRGGVYRGLVLATDPDTGEIFVSIPSLTGAGNRVAISGISRHAVEGEWKLPEVGSVVLIGSDDANGSTLFLIPTYTYDDEVRAVDFFGDFHGPVVFLARNHTGATLSKNTVVTGGSDNGELVISKANANDAAKPAIGILIEDVAPEAYGKVAVSGYVSPIDTSLFSANIDLYVGTTGNLVATPVGLTYPQVVAKVLKVGAAGSVVVTPKDRATGTGASGNYTGIFTGTIYATAGNIGGSASGWVINSNHLESRGSTKKIVLDGTDGEIYIGTYGVGAYNSASTPFYVNQSGQFSLSNKLTFNPTTNTLDVNGTVTADAGNIGGWSIQPNKLTSGTGASSVGIASSGGYPFYAGASNPAVAPFKVTDTGLLTASGVDLSGKMVATSGSVGGWLLSGNTIQSSGATPITLDSATGKITVGNENWGNTNNDFYVDSTGKFGLGSKLTWDGSTLSLDGTITAASGTIGGWSIGNTSLYAGTGSNYIALSSDNAVEYRTWAGHPTPASAPFFINKTGGLYASNASISGAITAASISGSQITGTAISGNTISGNTITGGTVSGASISGNTITGGTISGASVTAASISGGRISIGSNFTVDNSGNLTASNATITGSISATTGSVGGFLVGADSLTAGSGASAVGMGTTGYPFWAGSTTASNAPFRVSSTGVMNATNANIQGFINATGGSFTGAITAASIYSPVINDGRMYGTLNWGNILGTDLDLFDGKQTIGSQASAMYFRTDQGFVWYTGGSHSNGQYNAGGGQELLRLSNTEFTWKGNPIFTTATGGSGTGFDADLLDGFDSDYFAPQALLENLLGDLLYVGLYDPTTYVTGSSASRPIPQWTGGSATYRHGMYWISSGTDTVDYIVGDPTGRTTQQAEVQVYPGDWILATNPSVSPANYGDDLLLSQVEFQLIPFSSETFIKSQIDRHSQDPDPHSTAGYLQRSSTVMISAFDVSNKSLSASVATLLTAASPHGIGPGKTIIVSGVDDTFDGTYVTIAPTAASTNVIAYTLNAADVTSASATGLVGEQDTRRNIDVLFSRIGHVHDSEITSYINQHLDADNSSVTISPAANPHPQYLNITTASATFSPIGHNHDELYAPFNAVTDHTDLPDPHPQYLLQTETDALYAPISHTSQADHDGKYSQLGHTHTDLVDVFATDGTPSAKVWVGASAPSESLLGIGDLWVESPSIAPAPPGAPVNFSGVSTAGSVITFSWGSGGLAWPASTGATSAHLERWTGASWTTSASYTAPIPTSGSATGLSENTAYTYRLYAKNSVGTGTWASISVTTANDPPPPPTNPSVLATTASSIQLGWSAPSGSFPDPATNRYEVLRNNVAIATTGASSYTFTSLTENTTYKLSVKSVDQGTLRSTEASINGTTGNAAPGAPTSPNATVVSSSSLKLSWTAPAGVADLDKYQVTRNGGSSWTDVAKTSTNYTFTGLTGSTSYTLGVRSVDTGGLSSSTVSDSATTSPSDTTPPGNPTINSFQPETSYGRMVVRWDNPAASDIDSIKIQRSTNGTNWTDDITITGTVSGSNTDASLASGATCWRALNNGTAFSAGTTVYVRFILTDTTGNSRTTTTSLANSSYTLIASPINVTATGTSSWRNSNSGEWNYANNSRPYEGYYSNATYNYIGCYFYSNKLSSYYNSGRRTCTSMRMLLTRANDTGVSSPHTPVMQMHKIASRPADQTGYAQPTLYGSQTSTGLSLSYNENGYWTLPTSWRDGLFDGTYEGLCHRDTTSPVYAAYYSVGENSLSGLIEINHLG